MAIRFIRNVITIRTRPVAAALMWKSLWGRESQLNICIGMTVKAEFSQSKFRNGKSDCRGELGRKAMYVRAPIVMTGDRKSVVEGKSVSVRVDLGGLRIIKKKKKRSTNTSETH